MMQIIFGNRWRHLLGERDFWEHVGGIDIALAPSSFGQANTRVDGISNQLRLYILLLHQLLCDCNGHKDQSSINSLKIYI
jgi:hypothetical protein